MAAATHFRASFGIGIVGIGIVGIGIVGIGNRTRFDRLEREQCYRQSPSVEAGGFLGAIGERRAPGEEVVQLGVGRSRKRRRSMRREIA